jgi:CO/xanthine dehydrogenase Mo-binding subunit
MSVSRRDFLKTSGALIVSFSTTSLAKPLAFVQGPFDTHASHIDPGKLDSWIAVSADGTITAHTGKCDFGQGMFTVQAQLIAEELCVPLDRVKLIQCDTSVSPDQGTTSGSQSTPTNFNSDNLAQAAATAREALISMAANQLGEPTDQLAVADGVITGKTGRRITYAELIGSKQFNLPLSKTARRRSPSQWKVLGKPVRALETAALMTGQFEFVHTVRVPGMLHGRVVRPPEVGAAVASVDESSVKQIPGVVKVVVRNNFVGVIAEKQWQAVQAARQLKVKWNSGPALPAQKTFFDTMRKQPSQDALLVDSKDVQQQLAAARTVVQATYVYPYQMHGSVGASCAVAEVKPSQTTVWSATQSVYPTRSIVAKLLGLPLESVRVIYVRGSGCYGLNGADTVSIDAALLSHAAGKPVRVQLSRQDEMAWENYGAACVIEQRAALDDNAGALVVDQRRSTSRTCDQLNGATRAWPLAITNVFERTLRISKRVWRRVSADPDANLKWLVAPLLWVTPPKQLASTDQSGATLKLLHGEQAQRVAHDDANPSTTMHSMPVAPQPAKRKGESSETQIRFRLATTGRKPQEVDQTTVSARFIRNA